MSNFSPARLGIAQLDPRQLIPNVHTVRNGVQIWRNGSIAATAILIADDVTVVGVLDDVALPATLASIAVSFIFLEALDYYIAEMANENDDTGVEVRILYGAGTFAIPSSCKPEDPNDLEVLAGDRPGRSDRLGSNLRKTGCWCKNQDVRGAAHHIIPKTQGGEIGDRLRSCLKNKRKVDIDSSYNGVCLPQTKNAKSDAFVHAGDENVLHADRLPSLLRLCEDDNISNDQFKAKLRDIAEGYTKHEIRLP